MGSLTRYPNFFRFPWVPRSHAQLAWRLLDVSLLLYRPCREQNGAFPVKVLESLQFGVPLVATKVPKTADLEPYFPRSPFSDQLQRFACEQSRRNPQEIQSAFSHFSREMDPRLHLARVAEILKGASI